ncbi:MAG: cytochrome-c peroxidase [Planctomycetaceae bacterium]|nr:cytochrome-c peroxidase [Planctomycetales bacterium]MCB9924666.1 cytochrome-c peroxidase [Planctomycetaceae bacterium]
MTRPFTIVLLLTATAPGVVSADAPTPTLTPLPAEIPSPPENPTTAPKVALGKRLFFDPRLSGDNTMSCATCHLPEKAFADGSEKSLGHGGKPLTRNTQGLANVGLFSSFFWDGRAASLEEQALGPIESSVEMNQDLDELERELNEVEGYRQSFQEVFGTAATCDAIAKALAAFQRTLVTDPSPFDRYLAGDDDAISDEAKRGMELFIGDAGCIRCHHGPLLSDGKFYRIGASWGDKGRGLITNDAEDNHRFRTPSLRNIAETAPYMHDGSLETLYDVVMFYFRGVPKASPEGQPLDIEPRLDSSFSDIDSLVAFLRTLSGKLPHITRPELPE